MSASILVIDDDRAVGNILSKILARQGYLVETVETGEEALRKLEKRPSDLALVDVRLGDTNGIDLLDKIGMISPGTAAIVITGFSEEKIRTQALEKGVAAYLQKPVKATELIEIVEKTLRSRQDSLYA